MTNTNEVSLLKAAKSLLCKVGFHSWKPVARAYSWNWLFGTQWADTGRRICEHCHHEKRVVVEYAMVEGE